MNADFVKERISQLRLMKGVSEYQMSYDLGHSRGYINNISSGKALPSMNEFFAICDYFDITPIEFFDYENQSPMLTKQLSNEINFYKILTKYPTKNYLLIIWNFYCNWQ